MCAELLKDRMIKRVEGFLEINKNKNAQHLFTFGEFQKLYHQWFSPHQKLTFFSHTHFDCNELTQVRLVPVVWLTFWKRFQYRH